MFATPSISFTRFALRFATVVPDNSIDAFGDAYEYLMSMYASNAGKSGGEFFTPQEVSDLLTRMAVAGKTEVNKVYDPACGSGSLLLLPLDRVGRIGNDNLKGFIIPMPRRQ